MSKGFKILRKVKEKFTGIPETYDNETQYDKGLDQMLDENYGKPQEITPELLKEVHDDLMERMEEKYPGAEKGREKLYQKFLKSIKK